MGKVVKSMFGGASQSSGMAEMAAQQAQQKDQVEADNRRLAAVEEGNARVRRGGMGLSGYLDEKMRSLFGG